MSLHQIYSSIHSLDLIIKFQDHCTISFFLLEQNAENKNQNKDGRLAQY